MQKGVLLCLKSGYFFLKCCVLTCNVVSSFCKVCVFLSSSMGLTAARVVEKKPLTILSSSFTRPLKCNPLSLSSATQRKKKQSECLTGRAFKCGNNKSAGTTVPHDSWSKILFIISFIHSCLFTQYLLTRKKRQWNIFVPPFGSWSAPFTSQVNGSQLIIPAYLLRPTILKTGTNRTSNAEVELWYHSEGCSGE